MNQVYDVIVCGTGFSECILSGLLSINGKKVLHLDRNPYYGGESASLNLTNLFKKFPRKANMPRTGSQVLSDSAVGAQSSSETTTTTTTPSVWNNKAVATDTELASNSRCWSLGPYTAPPDSWGLNRDWNVDLIPKFIMANGKLVKILLKTGVKDYLEFQIVEGSYVYQRQKAGWWPSSTEKFIHKVPATESEALTSALVGLTEKLKAKSFFAFIAHYNDEKNNTWLPGPNGGYLDPKITPMSDCFKYFGVSKSIIEFVGHAIALHTSDDYLEQPMNSTMNKLRLYLQSLLRYGNSPFIYPMYGLGTLPEGFSRLSAVYGGVYMLNTPVENFIVDSTTSKIRGVQTSDGQIALADILICDPSYCLGERVVGESPPSNYPTGLEPSEPLKMPANCHLIDKMPGKVRKTGQVIRVINILNAPVPGTSQKKSCQIILPQAQLNRKTDIYVAVISAAHGICKEGKFVVLVSGTVETDDPMSELEPAFKLLGPIEQQFVAISDVFEASNDGKNDNVFVSDSYDAQSHFESATENVLHMWRCINGEELDLTTPRQQGADSEGGRAGENTQSSVGG